LKNKNHPINTDITLPPEMPPPIVFSKNTCKKLIVKKYKKIKILKK